MGMSSTATRGKRGRWVVLGLLVGLGALGYQAHRQASVFAQLALNAVFSNADTEAHGIWFAPNGDIVAKDVVLYLNGPTLANADMDPTATPGADASTLRFERMQVRTPDGWMFFLRNVLDRNLDKAQVTDLHVSFDGFDTQSGMEPSLGTFGPIGALSASPFESEGCLKHAYFLRSELGAMGLTPGATTLEVDVREADSRISTRMVLTTSGVSRTQYDREETIAKSASLLRLSELVTATQSERWDISDQGFVQARNAFCAKQDGVDPQTFVARHLASVQRLLETRGLVPDANSIAAYAEFAENGGHLAFGGSYPTPLHSSERKAARIIGTAWLRMQGKLEHGSLHSALQWHGTKPRPLETHGSTFAAMTRENGGVPPAMGALSTRVPAQVATATVPAPEPAAPAPVAMAAPTAPKYASSLPVPPAPSGGRLAWEDLPRFQGHMVQVYTMHAEPRTAMLVSADGKEARVRARMEGGHADYRISRESFVRALLIQ
jgi:hypothetical protein